MKVEVNYSQDAITRYKSLKNYMVNSDTRQREVEEKEQNRDVKR